MSYQVLARKWRPRNFREMVGQEHVLQALVNALDNDRLHHAYLFTGTRGVGKTTIARILAKCLNCETGVSSEPCGSCSSCVEIGEGRSVDLLEVDAASRTKVEDTRELLENVQYAPTHSRYKVYLIDEVHMLSAHSFNALLKTLEEPPPHVKFLLATTDPQKLPVTILSRCLQFNLKNMPPEQVVDHLRTVLDEENIGFEEPALWLLGRAAAGSMRDALSLTDQAIAFGAGKLSEADVRTMLGTVDRGGIYRLLDALARSDAAALLAEVAHMAEQAPDFEGSLDELISVLHRVAVAQAVPAAVDNSWGDAERIAGIGAALTAEDTQLFYQVALNGKRDIALAADPRSGFEMILLRMVAFRPAAVIDEHAELQELPLAGPTPEPDVAPEGGSGGKKPVREPTPAPAPADQAPCPATKVLPGDWPQLLEQLGLRGIVYNIASNCELRAIEGNQLQFVLDPANASLYNSGHLDRIRRALTQHLGIDVVVTIEPGELRAETPVQLRQRRQQERRQAAIDSMEADPVLQELINRFDGELDRAAVTPAEP